MAGAVILRLAAPMLAAALLLGCEARECKEARQQISAFCGPGSPASAAAAGKDDVKEACARAAGSLRQVRTTLARMNKKEKTASKKQLCDLVADNRHAAELSSVLMMALGQYQRAWGDSLVRQIREAGEAGDLKKAEALFSETRPVAPPSREAAAHLLGSMYLEPRGKVRPPAKARWQTVLLARKKQHSDGCVSMGNSSRVQAPNLERALKLFSMIKDNRRCAEVAYRSRDLPAYDRYVKALGKNTGLVDANRRINLLLALGRHEEAEADARKAAVRFVDDRTCVLVGSMVQCKKSEPRPPCGPMLVIAKLSEAAKKYTSARDAYSQAVTGSGSCQQMARGRLEALVEGVDGKPLPRFQVNGSVSAPAGAEVQVLLLPDVLRTMNPTRLPGSSGDDPHPGHMDHLGRAYVLEARMEGGSFSFQAVPPGVWDLVVVATGPTRYKVQGCWPAVRVTRGDVEAPAMVIAADKKN